MHVLVSHNYYQQPGGEDVCFDGEAELLRRKGHHVSRFTVHNDAIRAMRGLAMASRAIWNRSTYRDLRRLIRRRRPDVVHFHNTFPLLSPSAYYAAREDGVAVIQTVHNYRLLCPNAVFFRDGGVCEECLGRRFPWPGVMHACYRDNLAASGTVAAMLAVHRALHTWSKLVDVYITLTEFARNKLVEGGLAREKIVVKPNFVFPDPGAGQGRGGYALFAGRLSPEKGLDTMLTAWESLSVKPPLKIAGEGPLAPRVAELAQRSGNVEYLGRVPKEQVLNLMQGAAVLIFPSNCYEGFPMTIAEAFATGLPVIASGMGSMSSLIEHGRTGLHFRPGDTEDLASKVEWAFSHPGELADMRCQARARFETEYTADRNYALLMDIYGRSVRTK